MESLWQDLRLGSRRLGKSPAYAIMAVLSLALGSITTTAMMKGFLFEVSPLDPLTFAAVQSCFWRAQSQQAWSPRAALHRSIR